MIPANNLMLDLETLSVRPDAAVFEVALVEFTPHERNGDCKVSFIPDTGTIDASTVQWWLKQAVPCSLKTASMAEAEAVALIHSYLSRRTDFMLWAQPASFDCIILQALLRRHGLELPIDFRKWRDVRTVRELGDWPKPPSSRTVRTSHTAFDDCLRQIDTLCACWEGMK